MTNDLKKSEWGMIVDIRGILGLQRNASGVLTRVERIIFLAATIIIVLCALIVMNMDLSWIYRILVIMAISMMIGLPLGSWSTRTKKKKLEQDR